MASAEIEKNGSTLTVQPGDRMDTLRSPQLEQELQPYLADATQIVMDFTEVEYISSAGLRLLLWLEQQMETRGGEVQVIHANESVLKIFSLAGFMDVVHVIRD